MRIYADCWNEIINSEPTLLARTSSPGKQLSPVSPGKKKLNPESLLINGVSVNDKELKKNINTHLDGFYLLSNVSQKYIDPLGKHTRELGQRRNSDANKFEKEILALNCNLQVSLSESEELAIEIETLKKQNNVLNVSCRF